MREKASTWLAGFGKASVAHVALASPTHIRDGIMQRRGQIPFVFDKYLSGMAGIDQIDIIRIHPDVMEEALCLLPDP